jgi:hypothetical protein
MSIPKTNRLLSITVPMTLQIADGAHELELSLAYHPETGALHELVFVGRGKVGHGIDILLHDLGIKVSRAIQGRDPDTGKSPDGSDAARQAA